MRTGRKKPTKAKTKDDRVVCVSLPAELRERFAEACARIQMRDGIAPKRGSVGAMLIAKGLDAVERAEGVA